MFIAKIYLFPVLFVILMRRNFLMEAFRLSILFLKKARGRKYIPKRRKVSRHSAMAPSPQCVCGLPQDKGLGSGPESMANVTRLHKRCGETLRTPYHCCSLWLLLRLVA